MAFTGKLRSTCPYCGNTLHAHLETKTIRHDGTICERFRRTADVDSNHHGFGHNVIFLAFGPREATESDFERVLREMYDVAMQERADKLVKWARRQHRIAGLLASTLDISGFASEDVEQLLRIAAIYTQQLAVPAPDFGALPRVPVINAEP